MLRDEERNELIYATYEMRKDILTMCHNCGKQNGHLGGAMSAVEIMAVLYLRQMNLYQAIINDIEWDRRDRFVMSKGHGAMAMYAGLKQLGIYTEDEISKSIRGKDSVIFRHPKQDFSHAIECSVGSLGQGIGYAVGLADSFINKESGKVYVMVGDGECNEGAVWESAAYAAHRALENLTVIVDKNRLQLDGPTFKVLNMDNLAEKWSSFGFYTVEVDGHDLDEIVAAFNTSHQGKPLAIIAHTVKGRDIPFAENKTEWHDNFLSEELYQQALNALDTIYKKRLTDFERKNQSWTAIKKKHYEFEHVGSHSDNIEESVNINNWAEYTIQNIERWHQLGCKDIIGEVAVMKAATDKNFMLLYSDCKNRIGLNEIEEGGIGYSINQREVGISEQNMIAMAAGMQDSGYHVWAVAYAPFITMRVMDQIRVNLGYMHKNVCLIGLGAGLASGDLGSTHITIEDIACMRSIPNITVICPSDTTEIVKVFEALKDYPKPAYVRITSPAFENELVHTSDYDFQLEQAEILREEGDVTFITCGAVLAEVLKAADILKEQGIVCNVINMHTIKPLDTECLAKFRKSRLIVTVEEHSVYGGLGSAVAEYYSGFDSRGIQLTIGVKDKYFYADVHSNLMLEAGLSADMITNQIIEKYGEVMS